MGGMAIYSANSQANSDQTNSPQTKEVINSKSISMSDTLVSSLSINQNKDKSTIPEFQTSSWLAASPSAKVTI